MKDLILNATIVVGSIVFLAMVIAPGIAYIANAFSRLFNDLRKAFIFFSEGHR